MTSGSDELSVVVAVLTYRRPADLLAALPMLVAQVDKHGGRHAELLVIDNDPDGGAETAVTGFAHPRVRYVHEPTPGIAAGRNRALIEAAGSDILVFIDDDERPVEGWLGHLLSTYALDRPAAVVGPVVSEFSVQPEAWVTAGRFFDRRRLTTGTPVTIAATNNLLLDLGQLRELGVTFDERFGMTGGSDTLFTGQLSALGARLVWCAEALVVDVVPESRLTRSWVLRRAFRSGNTTSRVQRELATSNVDVVRAAVFMLGHGSVRLAGGLARFAVGVTTGSMSQRARGARTLARGGGMVTGALGYTYAEYRRKPAQVARPMVAASATPAGPRRRRVGIDAHVLDGKYQGSRTWLLEILRRAPALAPDTTFVVYTRNPRAAAVLLSAPNIEHRRIVVGSALPRLLAFWPWALERHDLALLVTQYMSPLTHRDRQVVVVHDVLFETFPRLFPWRTVWRNRLLVRISARRARKVLTVSNYSRREIARVYGLSVEDIDLVRNGIGKAEPSSPARRSEARAALPAVVLDAVPYVLFVGRLEPRKNLALVLAAMRHVRHETVRLVVVGRDDFEADHTLAALRSESRAIHLVDLARAELDALLTCAAALVYPSLAEGWGLPVIEALAAGTPVIASNRTAIPEAGGACCTYFDPTGADAELVLARLIDRAAAGGLSVDEGLVTAHLRGLTWEHSAEAFVQVLGELTGGSP